MAVTKARAVYVVTITDEDLNTKRGICDIVAGDLCDDSVAHTIPMRLIQLLPDGQWLACDARE